MRRPSSLYSGWVAEQGGAVAVYVALILPVLVGLAVLVVDGGRLFNLDTSLRNNVDALALAGAAELDRRPDSRVRSARAMQALVKNSQLFAGGTASLDVAFDAATGMPTSQSDVRWCWLKSIPADNCKIALTDNCQPSITSSSQECSFEVSAAAETSNYIWVQSRPSAADFSMLLPAAFIGGEKGVTPRRTAVAGMSRLVCQPTPIMVCNPWESQGIDTVAELRTKIGSITTAREYGAGGPMLPGQFGLLDPAEVFDTCNNSAGGVVQKLELELAGAPQTSCLLKNGLCPKTGAVASLDNAVNTRFDIYKGSIRNLLSQNPTAVVPAARTIWNTADQNASGCDVVTARELNGLSSGVWYPREENWNRVAYFSQYTNAFPNLTSTSAVVNLPDGKSKPLGQLTRYETYKWEVAQAKLGTAAVPPYTYTKPAARTCFAEKVNNGAVLLGQLGLSGRESRRDIYVAIANCAEIQTAIANGASYRLNGASTEVPLPALAVGKFFITEPINRTYESTVNISQSSTSGNSPNAWPQSTCPLTTGNYSFVADLSGNIRAGTTYYLQRPNGTSIEAAIASGAAATITNLADAFRAAATEAGVASLYQFCTKTGTDRLFIGTSESSNQNQFTFGLSVVDAGKRMFIELADVYSTDNGADVTRDVVRLYR